MDPLHDDGITAHPSPATFINSSICASTLEQQQSKAIYLLFIFFLLLITENSSYHQSLATFFHHRAARNFTASDALRPLGNSWRSTKPPSRF